MSRIYLILILIAVPFTQVFADITLDNFFLDAPRELIVKRIECFEDGHPVPPRRLDKVVLGRDSDLTWTITLFVDNSSVTTHLGEHDGNYTYSFDGFAKHIQLDMRVGPEFRLDHYNGKLEFSQIEELPSGSLWCDYI